MKWFLDEAVSPHQQLIAHGDQVLFIGSCFSEHIYAKGREAGFNFENTRFGTLFHPVPIARILNECIAESEECRIIQRDNRFYTWDAFSKFNGESEEDLRVEIQNERAKIRSALQTARFLFITLGTAKEYKTEDGLTVANCHKFPANFFSSQLSDITEMQALYSVLIENLNTFNPNLEIVFTVSPVRHSKEGLVQNNRSKARLLMLCEKLTEFENVYYFPAYEILMDELRDYRFYAEDLVHPNSTAIDYVWGKFNQMFITPEAQNLAKNVLKKRKFFTHKSSDVNKELERTVHLQKMNDLQTFLKLNPTIKW